jgi:hypothetical protein
MLKNIPYTEPCNKVLYPKSLNRTKRSPLRGNKQDDSNAWLTAFMKRKDARENLWMNQEDKKIIIKKLICKQK